MNRWMAYLLLLEDDVGSFPASFYNLIQWLWTTDDGADIDDKIGTFSKPDYAGVSCLTSTGAQTITSAGIVSGAVVINAGTAVGTATAGLLTFTAGTISQVSLDGVPTFACEEGAGFPNDVSGLGNDATAMTATWTTSDDIPSWEAEWGFHKGIRVLAGESIIIPAPLNYGASDYTVAVEFILLSTSTSVIYDSRDANDDGLRFLWNSSDSIFISHNEHDLIIPNASVLYPRGGTLTVLVTKAGTVLTALINGDLYTKTGVTGSTSTTANTLIGEEFSGGSAFGGIIYSFAASGVFSGDAQDASITTFFDSSGNGNDADITGLQSFIPALPFKSRSIATLDGVADTIDFGTHDITTWNTFYSQGYFRSTSSVRGMIVSVIHSGADDIRIQLESTGRVRFALDDGTVKSVLTAGTYNDGDWHFYSAYLTGTTMSLMVDAETAYNYTADFDFAGASGAISVGSRSGSSVFFDGELDDIRIGGGVDEINLIVKDPFIVTGKASAVAPNPEGSGGDGTIATGAGGLDSFWGQRIEDAVDGIWVASNYELLTNRSCVLYNLVHNGGSYTITQTDTDYINGTANRWSDGAAFYDLTFAQHQAHVNGLYGSWTKNVTIDGLVLPSEDGQYVIDVAGGAPYDFDWVPGTIYEYNQNVAYWTEGAAGSIEPQYDLDGLMYDVEGEIIYGLPD